MLLASFEMAHQLCKVASSLEETDERDLANLHHRDLHRAGVG
jgi:hypothetical protein